MLPIQYLSVIFISEAYTITISLQVLHGQPTSSSVHEYLVDLVEQPEWDFDGLRRRLQHCLLPRRRLLRRLLRQTHRRLWGGAGGP